MKMAIQKTLPVSVLKPAEYNPRKKLKPGDPEYEKIKDSILEFGFADPLVVNSDMTIIGGHQRLSVAVDLGYTEVPCAVVDLDKTQEKALNIALNKITGAWDESLLAALLQDIQNSDFDLGKTGFDPPEIETLFNKVHDKNVKEDDFDIDGELQNPVFSKPGDLWILGPHSVICGDSTGEEVYTRLMDGQKANLVLTDPPYNVDVEETAGKILNDNMPDEDFYQFLLSAYRCMHANLAEDGSIYVWHADTEGLNFRRAFKDAGFYLSGCCIWKKNALVLGRSPYQWIRRTSPAEVSMSREGAIPPSLIMRSIVWRCMLPDRYRLKIFIPIKPSPGFRIQIRVAVIRYGLVEDWRRGLAPPKDTKSMFLLLALNRQGLFWISRW